MGGEYGAAGTLEHTECVSHSASEFETEVCTCTQMHYAKRGLIGAASWSCNTLEHCQFMSVGTLQTAVSMNRCVVLADPECCTRTPTDHRIQMALHKYRRMLEVAHVKGL